MGGGRKAETKIVKNWVGWERPEPSKRAAETGHTQRAATSAPLAPIFTLEKGDWKLTDPYLRVGWIVD